MGDQVSKNKVGHCEVECGSYNDDDVFERVDNGFQRMSSVIDTDQLLVGCRESRIFKFDKKVTLHNSYCFVASSYHIHCFTSYFSSSLLIFIFNVLFLSTLCFRDRNGNIFQLEIEIFLT